MPEWPWGQPMAWTRARGRGWKASDGVNIILPAEEDCAVDGTGGKRVLECCDGAGKWNVEGGSARAGD